MSTTLTEPQQAVLAFIQSQIDANGFPPTRQEIADHMGFRSVNAAHEVVVALERKGRLKLFPGISRGMSVVTE